MTKVILFVNSNIAKTINNGVSLELETFQKIG